MRMNHADDGRPTAAELVNSLDHPALVRIFRDLGEERFASRIASVILVERQKEPITTTARLATVVSQAVPRKAWPPKTHPATRVFQALRMAVNAELEELHALLDSVPNLLRQPGDRIGIIGFHSLELRPVKERFRQLANPCTCPPELPVCICGARPRFRLLTRSGLGPTKDEIQTNPRARSARFWALERVAADDSH
jgi:16S rRNA (cytosine1402-N4)-methyltransferase